MDTIQFAFRTINEQENRYSSRERDALGVVFVLKKFSISILSEKTFIFYTNHQALQKELKKKDIQGQLARQLDLVAEYNFKVNYHPGYSNGAADYLFLVPIV